MRVEYLAEELLNGIQTLSGIYQFRVRRANHCDILRIISDPIFFNIDVSLVHFCALKCSYT